MATVTHCVSSFINNRWTQVGMGSLFLQIFHKKCQLKTWRVSAHSNARGLLIWNGYLSRNDGANKSRSNRGFERKYCCRKHTLNNLHQFVTDVNPGSTAATVSNLVRCNIKTEGKYLPNPTCCLSTAFVGNSLRFFAPLSPPTDQTGSSSFMLQPKPPPPMPTYTNMPHSNTGVLVAVRNKKKSRY